VGWDADELHAFAQTIDSAADRLNHLVGNLLDMSRVQAGAVRASVRPVFLEDVVAAALASIDPRPEQVEVDVPDSLPAVETDPTLLERALAHIIANSLAWSPRGRPVRVEAALVSDRVHLRVIDRGPGVDRTDRERVFQPFQQLGDRDSHGGVGLGLAVARGFVEAVEGTILLDDTPGGGLTVLIDLPVAPVPEESSAASS